MALVLNCGIAVGSSLVQVAFVKNATSRDWSEPCQEGTTHFSTAATSSVYLKPPPSPQHVHIHSRHTTRATLKKTSSSSIHLHLGPDRILERQKAGFTCLLRRCCHATPLRWSMKQCGHTDSRETDTFYSHTILSGAACKPYIYVQSAPVRSTASGSLASPHHLRLCRVHLPFPYPIHRTSASMRSC